MIIDHALHQRHNPKAVILNHDMRSNCSHHEDCPCEVCYSKNSFSALQSSWITLPICIDEYDRIEPDSKPDEKMLLLCPFRVFGYSLRYRNWGEQFSPVFLTQRLNLIQESSVFYSFRMLNLGSEVSITWF